jgi:hypothetical protein
MYLSASGIVLACDITCIYVLVESLLPVIGQSTTIQQAHKYMTDNRPQWFNKHKNKIKTCGEVYADSAYANKKNDEKLLFIALFPYF